MDILHGMLAPAGIAGILAGLVVAAVPLFLAIVALRQRSAALARRLEALTATNRRNHAIVEASGEGVLELDNVGRVRYANPSAAKLLGYELEELPGLDYRVLINTGEDREPRTDPVRRVRGTTDIMRGVGALLRRKDGQLRPVEYKIVPVPEAAGSVATVLAFR